MKIFETLKGHLPSWQLEGVGLGNITSLAKGNHTAVVVDRVEPKAKLQRQVSR